MKYRKLPVEVEARQWDGSPEAAGPIIDWVNTGDHTATYHCLGSEPEECESEPHSIMIKTLEGKMEASAGDYIIRGVQGEFYPCKPDIFEATYKSSEDELVSVEQDLAYQAETGFNFMLDMQAALEESWGRRVDHRDPEHVSTYVRQTVLCALDELHEVLAEVHWKPWKDKRGIKDVDNYREEMADVMHFILNLYLAAGLTGRDIISDYLSKNYTNQKRNKSQDYRAS